MPEQEDMEYVLVPIAQFAERVQKMEERGWKQSDWTAISTDGDIPLYAVIMERPVCPFAMTAASAAVRISTVEQHLRRRHNHSLAVMADTLLDVANDLRAVVAEGLKAG